jgi:hypothetical protein
MPLVACPRCARHVRTRESKCPFCALALAVVTGSLVVACAENPPPQPREVPVYGAPAPTVVPAPVATDGGTSTTPPPPDDGRQVKPMYGMPSPRQ